MVKAKLPAPGSDLAERKFFLPGWLKVEAESGQVGTPEEIDAVRYANLEKDGIGHNTIKFIHNMVRSALEVAVQCDLIRKNPAVGVKYGGEVQEKKALTKTEQESLLEFLNGENIYNIYLPMITIMIGTGLRVSELCGLTWADVNFKENTITVNKQLLKTRGKAEDGKTLYVEKTKTENGKRTIPMTAAVHKAFRDQQKLMLMLERKCFTEIDGISDFIFVTKNHFPFSVANVNAALKNIVNAHNKANAQGLRLASLRQPRR